jgi:hypothetical protein
MQRLACSFCGKAQNEVARLIAGPTVYICNECVMLCVQVLENDVRFKVEPLASDASDEPRSERPTLPLGPSALVHLPGGTTVGIDGLDPWAHFFHDGEHLEWIAGRRPAVLEGDLVVGVRKSGSTGAALGLSFPADRDPTEQLAREVATIRRGPGGADRK